MFPVEGVAVHQVWENSEFHPTLNKTKVDSKLIKRKNCVVELLAELTIKWRPNKMLNRNAY